MAGNDNDDATRWEVSDADERGAGYYANGRHIADIELADTHVVAPTWVLSLYLPSGGYHCLDYNTQGAALDALQKRTGHPGTTTPGDAPGDCEGRDSGPHCPWCGGTPEDHHAYTWAGSPDWRCLDEEPIVRGRPRRRPKCDLP